MYMYILYMYIHMNHWYYWWIVPELAIERGLAHVLEGTSHLSLTHTRRVLGKERSGRVRRSG